MSLASKLSALAAGAALAISAAPAHADTPAYGSASYITVRDCGSKLPTQACTGPGTSLVAEAYAGGPLQGTDTTFSAVGGFGAPTASTTISFGGGALPEIHQADNALGNVRINVNAFADNSFTYEGAAPTELSYAGDLHIVDSSLSPSGDANLAGGAGYLTWVAIWDPSLAAGFTSARQATLEGYGNYDCSTAGVLAFGYAVGSLSGGEQNIHLATSSCSGSPVMINPGETILAVAWLQTPSNRYGWVDASHTFVMDYDPSLSEEVRANLVDSMVPGYAAVPEPATWAMMILGFGLVGATARRRAVARA